jgi:gamma-glutamyl-gamma-aminobutyrate hydrolase PuuD
MFTSSKSVLVVGSPTYAKAIQGLFAEVSNDTNTYFHSPHRFDAVFFTGGEDVDPDLYDDKSPLGLCHISRERDRKEVAIWTHTRRNKIKMIGICRGAQFINVMSGGKLMHHINGHTMSNHFFTSNKVGFKGPIMINSMHHQMIIPPNDGYIIGWCPTKLSTEYIGYNDEKTYWPGPEVEAVYIPRTKCIGVQYHPEIMDESSEGFRFFRNMVRDFLIMEEPEFIMAYTGNKKCGVASK